MTKAVIMAGGEGVRLRPLTYSIPKPLLPLGEYTVIEFIIKGLAEQGIRDFFILAHYQFEKFRRCEEYAGKYGINVKLIKEEKKMGTIGGLFMIKKKLSDDFFVINADIVSRIEVADMLSFHKICKAALTLGAKAYKQQVPYGVIKSGKDFAFVDIKEKPSRFLPISAGINLFSPDALDIMDGSPIDLPDLALKLKNAGKRVVVHDVKGLWLDIGRVEDYEKAVELLETLKNGQ
jgi:NDP-sugar pyrophosphorylase family protein